MFDGQLLEQLRDETVATTEPRGAPGTRIFAFRALAPGETRLRLLKRRPWESEAKDELVYALEISTD